MTIVGNVLRIAALFPTIGGNLHNTARNLLVNALLFSAIAGNPRKIAALFVAIAAFDSPILGL